MGVTIQPSHALPSIGSRTHSRPLILRRQRQPFRSQPIERFRDRADMRDGELREASLRGLTTVIRQNRRITKINLQHNYFDILYYSRYIPNTLKRKNIFVKL